MYLHLTQAHSHLRLWSEAAGILTLVSRCPHRILNCCWRVPFTALACTYPSYHWLAAVVGRPGGSSVPQSAAEHSLDFLIYLLPPVFSARVLVGWLCAQTAHLYLFLWESCIPLYSLSPTAPLLLGHHSHPAVVKVDTLTPFPQNQAHSQWTSLSPPLGKSRYLLCFSAWCHRPESVMATWARPVTTFSFLPSLLSLASCYSRHLPHQHLPWQCPPFHYQRGWADKSLHFLTTCKACRMTSD